MSDGEDFEDDAFDEEEEEEMEEDGGSEGSFDYDEDAGGSDDGEAGYDLDEDDGGGSRYHRLLERDIEEVKRSGHFAGWNQHPLELTVWVGLSVADMDAELASACGIYRERKLVCKLVFANPPQYMKSHPRVEDKRIVIRQSSDDDLNKAKLTDMQPFGLWWTLEQRLNDHLKNVWGSLAEAAREAINNLSEQPSRTSQIQSLMELCQVSQEVAAYAFHKYKGMERASEMLLEPAIRKKIEKEAKGGKLRQSLVQSREGGREGNLLMEVISYIQKRLRMSTQRCLVCDQPHPFELLKPQVCSGQLCNFQFVNLGLGINVESEIMNAPETVDYLISMTAAASRGNHFDPFPSVQTERLIDGVKESIAFDSSKPQEVGEVINRLPEIKVLQGWVEQGVLKDRIDEIHPLLYKLIRWILGTNQAHLHLLKDTQKINSLGTEYQFVMKSSPPAKEKKFQLLKKEHSGSFWAFHGSPVANWHSILRHGLKNYSGTRRQAHGAAYGPGIYMAVDSGTSLGYTGHNQAAGWQNSMFGSSIKCMAMCEVIDHGDPEPAKCKGSLHRPRCSHCAHAPFYRCEDEDLVCTRFLFIYPTSSAHVNVQAGNVRVPPSLLISWKDIRSSSEGDQSEMLQSDD